MADVTTPATGEQIEDKLYTIEEFEQFLETAEDARHFQLIEGEIFYVPAPELRHGFAAFLIGHFLALYVFEKNLGQIGVRVGYRPENDRKTWLEIDVAYLSFNRFPFETINGRKSLSVAPDICAEVISPGNTWREINTKIKLYLAGGATCVWVIEPKLRQVTVYNMNGNFEILGSNDILRCSDLLPGFSLNLAEFWAKVRA
jgi:Uma2 family endonuclease